MIRMASTRANVPSQGALRVLRRLALTGSTVGVIGGACTVGALNYEIQRRIQIAEKLVENKRGLHSAYPKYNRSARDSAVSKMLQAAEAGEFQGLESLKADTEATGEETISAAEGQGLNGDGENNSILADNNDQDVSIPGLPERPTTSQSSTPPPLDKPSTDAGETERPFHERSTPNKTFSDFDCRILPRDQPNDGIAHVKKLFGKGKAVLAAHHLLKEMPAHEFSEAYHALAIELCYANIKENNMDLALKIFRWVEGRYTVTADLWLATMEGFALRKWWDKLSELYCKHSPYFTVTDNLLRKKIMKALVYTRRFRAAKDMCGEYLEYDPDCSLCATYIGNLRKYARSTELVETEFRTLLLKLSATGQVVAEKLFHPLLMTYVGFGHFEKAEDLIHEMQTWYKIDLSVTVLGILAFGKALQADWEGVDQKFQEIATLGGGPMNIKSFRFQFDRIFLEYFLSHSGQEIRDFVFRAVENYRLIPDKILFDHILMAYVQKGTRDMIRELVETAGNRLWQVDLNSEHILNYVRHQRLSCENGSVGMWPMYRAAQQRFGPSPSLNRVLDFDKWSFPNSEAFKAPNTSEDTGWWRQLESAPEISRRIDNYGSLRGRMVIKMHAGKFSAAHDLYKAAKRAGRVMNRDHVKLAVVASTLQHATFHEPTSVGMALLKTKSLLEGECHTFEDFDENVTPRLFKTILQSEPVAGVEPPEVKVFALVKSALFLFYETLLDLGLSIKHNMLTSLIFRATNGGNPRAALSLVNSVNRSKYGARAFFDVYALIAIARSFARCGNLQGVQWAMVSAFQRQAANDTRDLLVEVHSIIEQLRLRKTSLSAEREPEFRREVKQLSALAHALSREQRARKYPISKFYAPAAAKGGQGPGDYRWRGNSSMSLYYTLMDWDERLELHNALTTREQRLAGSTFPPDTQDGAAADEATVSAPA